MPIHMFRAADDYSRDAVKALTDKVLDMTKADAAEVTLSGGERSGTRWANSSITTNLVQYDRNLSVTVYLGDKSGSSSTRDFSDAGLKDLVDEARANANQATGSARPDLLGPQTYIPVDAALPAMVNFGPAERAKMVRESIDICEKMGTVGAGYIPKTDQTNCTANSKGLFAYYRDAEAGLVLTCRMADGSGSGWAGITGVKDLSLIDPKVITETASNKAVKSKGAKSIEPGR
ncbi:MAG TPA: DNA gyrase modulator, partial [Vicinamibacterales bacterium]|nr:DNA gyrase modulator [Vicinamibacterales bacterium]